MTEAEAANQANFTVDDGELKLAIVRRRFDVAPRRIGEKPAQDGS
jgi:hypothetical protein